VAGEADCIVSGDRNLLSLERVGDIPILSVAQFLATLEVRERSTLGPEPTTPE
jgi:predicted nucleic acid-binding protein